MRVDPICMMAPCRLPSPFRMKMWMKSTASYRRCSGAGRRSSERLSRTGSRSGGHETLTGDTSGRTPKCPRNTTTSTAGGDNAHSPIPGTNSIGSARRGEMGGGWRQDPSRCRPHSRRSHWPSAESSRRSLHHDDTQSSLRGTTDHRRRVTSSMCCQPRQCDARRCVGSGGVDHRARRGSDGAALRRPRGRCRLRVRSALGTRLVRHRIPSCAGQDIQGPVMANVSPGV